MKLNNKGITLVEIIISVALISIVLIFLFSLLIQVNNENADNEIKSSYLVTQSTFIKQIEEDFIEYKFQNGYECSSIDSLTSETDSSTLHLSRILTGTAVIQKAGTKGNVKCLRFEFDPDSEYTYAYLFIYKREDVTTATSGDYQTILSYYRGDFKQSVELEDFDWDEDNYDQTDTKYNANCKSDYNGFKSCTLPIIGPDSNDYSINLSYSD